MKTVFLFFAFMFSAVGQAQFWPGGTMEPFVPGPWWIDSPTTSPQMEIRPGDPLALRCVREPAGLVEAVVMVAPASWQTIPTEAGEWVGTQPIFAFLLWPQTPWPTVAPFTTVPTWAQAPDGGWYAAADLTLGGTQWIELLPPWETWWIQVLLFVPDGLGSYGVSLCSPVAVFP